MPMKSTIEAFVAKVRNDAGFTLVELVIGMVLASSVLFLIAVLVSGIYSTQNSVLGSSQSTGETQTFSAAFKKAIRSATATKLTSVTVGSQKGQLLIARVLVGTDQQNLAPASTCQQFLWLGSKMYFSTATSAAALPVTNSLSRWSQLVSGVESVNSGVGVFSQQGLATSVDLVTSLDHGLGSVLSTTQTAPDVTQVSSPCF
jgi:type II secretory pathway component PulJ